MCCIWFSCQLLCLTNPLSLLSEPHCTTTHLLLSTLSLLLFAFAFLPSAFCLCMLPSIMQHICLSPLLQAVHAMTGGAPGDRSHHRAGPGGVATQSGCWSGPASHSGPAAHPGQFLLENLQKVCFCVGQSVYEKFSLLFEVFMRSFLYEKERKG